jgi:hypothetical protein
MGELEDNQNVNMKALDVLYKSISKFLFFLGSISNIILEFKLPIIFKSGHMQTKVPNPFFF